jgi:hypothetical protein
MTQTGHHLRELKRIGPRLRISVHVQHDLHEQRDRTILPCLLLAPAHTEHVEFMQRQIPELAIAEAKVNAGEAPESVPGDALAKGPVGASSVAGWADAVCRFQAA